jgi:acyl-coenzyme A thioesterase PaaI-like protein
MSLLPAGTDVLSVEFKTNLLAPAVGERFEARAAVKRSGRRLSVVVADAFAIAAGQERIVATMLATIMRMESA